MMNTLGGVIKLAKEVQPTGTEVSGLWAVSLDLQDVYIHVAVDPRDTKFCYNWEGYMCVSEEVKKINVFQYLNDWLVVQETL